ncbi:outer membrane protein assembly factor BamB family protein [Chondromyces apiculatus]|uniref:Pyrrolo-quinoline quinone repeat domain-containing protein n=1 Tax=Chondromyces apiculatus DSM 436 TaxID=1192034 RepID=A0A017TF88_9BACT|nr:PQQ-binding-like beta-propeller repeat protein [Chondromyces apiculatus]EYF07485.1 Hypothetical protein CAP_0238 [Chondromyces apiculatus DSM 436]
MRYAFLLILLQACAAGVPSPATPNTDLFPPGARLVARRPPPPQLGEARHLGDFWVGTLVRDDGRFDAIAVLDAERHTPRWRHTLEGPATSLTWAVASRDVLVVQIRTAAASYLLGLDARSGAVRWREDDDTSAALMVEGILVTDGNGKLLGRRATDGAVMWMQETFVTTMAAGGPWLVTGHDEDIAVIDPRRGETRHRLPIAAPNHQAQLAIEDSTLYVSLWGEGIRMVAASLSTGAILWQSPVLDTPLYVGEPAPGHRHVFACTLSNVILGWDKRTGARTYTRGVPSCNDLAAHPGPPEELSMSAPSDTQRLHFPVALGASGASGASRVSVTRPVLIEGTVTNTRGQRVADVDVAIGISTVRSDARGHYRATLDFPGTVCAQAQSSKAYSRLTCIEPTPERPSTLDLLLERPPPSIDPE